MPTSLLQILNDCLLALLLLFFLRTLRAVWVQVNPPPAPAPIAAPPKARPTGDLRLRLVGSPDQVYDIGDEVTLGRSPGCGLSLPDSTVSQIHARLYRQQGKLFVEDLGSTNGTWVNKAKVSAPVALRKGDRLVVGGTMLEVTK